MGMTTNIFDGANEQAFNEAEVNKKGNYLRAGEYYGRIDCTKDGLTFDKIAFIVIEMTIVKVLDDYGGTGHRLGEEVDLMFRAIHIPKVGLDYFYTDCKQAFAAMLNIEDSNTITLEDCKECFEEDGPLEGFVVHIKARNWEKKPKEGDDPNKPKRSYIAPGPLKRRLSIAEVQEELSEEAIEKFWPGGVLKEMLAIETALNGEKPKA